MDDESNHVTFKKRTIRRGITMDGITALIMLVLIICFGIDIMMLFFELCMWSLVLIWGILCIIGERIFNLFLKPKTPSPDHSLYDTYD